MSTSWIINTVISALLLPPLSLILLCLLGLCLRRRWPRSGLAVSVTAMLLLILLSTYPGAMLVVAPLEKMNAPLATGKPDMVDTAGAEAIVVLGSSRISAAPEYAGRDIPTAIALQRLHYAAYLQRQTHLPLLVSGGQPDGSAISEAAIMARVLRQDFAVPVQWLEQQSNNTAENAQYSARLLQQAGIKRVLLVTDALHMQRAKTAFQHAGLTVTPAPTIFLSAVHPTIADYLPRSAWLQRSSYALHEWLGIAWYHLRYRKSS